MLVASILRRGIQQILMHMEGRTEIKYCKTFRKIGNDRSKGTHVVWKIILDSMSN